MSRRGGGGLPAVDDLDLRIISRLKDDGRRTFRSIATDVAVSEATVRQRVQRLIDADVLRIVAVTDPTALGVELRATVALKATGNLDAVADLIAAIDEVDYVVVTTGRYDVLAEVSATDMRHFYAVLDRIRDTDGVAATETLMYMRVVKQTYPWPPA